MESIEVSSYDTELDISTGSGYNYSLWLIIVSIILLVALIILTIYAFVRTNEVRTEFDTAAATLQTTSSLIDKAVTQGDNKTTTIDILINTVEPEITNLTEIAVTSLGNTINKIDSAEDTLNDTVSGFCSIQTDQPIDDIQVNFSIAELFPTLCSDVPLPITSTPMQTTTGNSRVNLNPRCGKYTR